MRKTQAVEKCICAMKCAASRKDSVYNVTQSDSKVVIRAIVAYACAISLSLNRPVFPLSGRAQLSLQTEIGRNLGIYVSGKWITQIKKALYFSYSESDHSEAGQRMKPKGKLAFTEYVQNYYRTLWVTSEIDREKEKELERAAVFPIGKNRERYEKVAEKTGVPWFIVGAIHHKECSGDFKKGLHNGQRWDRVTTIVPKGKGPFRSWEDAAIDALNDKMDWLMPIIGEFNIEGILYFCERYNGAGYYHRGINSPYLWAYTNHYTKGLFVSDGNFDKNAVSKNPGCVAIFKKLIELGAVDANLRIPPKPPEFKKPIDLPRISQMTRNEKILRVAASQLGVKEWKNGSNPQVEKYLDFGSRKDNRDSGLTDDVPWCAGFVAYCLEIDDLQPVMGSTNSLMARSYEHWGLSSKNDPLAGDIVTFYRNGLSSGQGHVAFFLKKMGSYVYCLGGNQNDEVNVTRYSTERMTDIRRSSKQFEIDKADREKLLRLSTEILAGIDINDSGSLT